MKWEQIESKWALMTHRIRADFRAGERPSTAGDVDLQGASETVTAGVADLGADRGGSNEIEAVPK